MTIVTRVFPLVSPLLGIDFFATTATAFRPDGGRVKVLTVYYSRNKYKF
jgi:hypothetical protein